MNCITFPIKNELFALENELKKVIANCDNFLLNDLNNFMFSNPKRLRPILIFLFSKILKIEGEIVNKIALITELIHNASIIHDDIIDEEKIRRNFLTFNAKFGSKMAVLEGDLLLAIALEKLSETTLDISKIFASKIKATINGEIIQNENISKITDIETYYKKTFNKTGNLFFAGVNSLYTLKNIDNSTKEKLNLFLKNFTLAFQIKNDIDNFKKNSSDYKNGNYTLPVIYFFMENNTAEINQNDLNFEKYIDKSCETVEKLKSEAIDSLEYIENSEFKNALIEITKYILRS